MQRSPLEENRKDDLHSANTGSSTTDEGLVLSQQLGNNIFSGPGLDSDSEELISDTSDRIRTSIMRLLEMMEETTQQLLDSKSVQQELMDTLNMRDSEAQDRSQRLQDLTEQLKQEINAREQLALELHKSQGLVEGFMEERKSLNSKLKDHEDREAVLIMENETLRNQVHDLQLSESEVTSLRNEVQRQQNILYDNAGHEQQDVAKVTDNEEWLEKQGLLDEIRQLNDDKRLMSQLMQQNQESYEKRTHELLSSGEDIEHRYSELLEEKRQQVDDLKLQLEAVDRQLKANKQFLNEQAHEREQEREEFQKEINQWRTTVQQMERQQNTEIRLKKEVEELSDQLESRISTQSQMLMKKEQLERDIQDKDLNALELKQLVEQLEQELDEKVTKEKQQEQRILQLEEQISKLQEINEELSEEMKLSTTEDKKIICSLETQLDDQRLVYEKKALTLDEELKKARRIEEELSSEKAALEQHVCENLLQIASLKNQLDESRQRKLSLGMLEEPEESAVQLQIKENELDVLSDMVDKLELQVERKNSELTELKKRLNGNLDNSKDGNDEDDDDHDSVGGSDGGKEPPTSQSSYVSENTTRVLQLKEENERLKSQVSSLQQQLTTDGFSSLTQQLLDEKNEQIDQLRNQIAEQTQSNPLFGDLSSENSELREQLQKKVTDLEEKDTKLHSLTALVEELQSRPYVSDDSFMGDMSLPFERGSPYIVTNSMTERTSLQQELSAVITDRDQQINSLQTELLQKEDKSSQMRIELMLEHEETVTSLREMLQERDTTADEMCTEIDGLHAEITNLGEHQAKLQEDFDTVQEMLEGKDKEIDELTKEISELRSQVDNSDVVMRYEAGTKELKKKVKELENVIEEKMEENYTLNEKIEEMGNLKDEVSQVRSELEKEKKLVESKSATLQNMERRVESSNKVIGQLQQREDHWQLKYSQTELQLREREEHLHQLQNEVMEREESDEKVRQRLNVAEQQVGVQQHNIQALQSRVSDSEARLKESRETISELKDTLASLEEEKEQMAGRMTSKDALIAKLQEQLHHLEKKSHDQAVEISQREKSYMTLVKMHQEKDELISIEEGRTLVLRAEVDDLQNELLLREEEQSKVQAELDECKIRLDNLNKSVVDNKVTASNSVDASSSPRRSSSECEEEDDKATVSKLQSDLETSQRVTEEKSKEIENLQTELQERNTQLSQLRLSVDIERKKSDQLQSKCEQLQTELQEAWEMKLVNDNHIDDLKKKLFKLESEELKPSNLQSLEDTQVIQSKFTDLWQEIQKRESDVERLEMELVEANVKVRSQEAEMQDSSLQTAEDGGQLSEQINILLGKLEASQVDIESKEAKIVSYENELQIKDSMLQQLQQQLEKSASSYHSSKQEYHTLLGEEQIEATKAEGRIVVLRSEVDDLQKQLVSKETELQTVRDHLMDTQIQLVNRAQEMTRICQHHNSFDEDQTDSSSSKAVHQEKPLSEDTIKSTETVNMKPQLPETLVHRLESELEKTRSLLQLRIGQLEEKNLDTSGTSADESSTITQERVIGHIKQVYNELLSMRTILEQLCHDKAAQQIGILEKMSDNQQTRVRSDEMLQELSSSSLMSQTDRRASGFGATNVVWGATSVESPEFRTVVPNERLQKLETTTKQTNIEATLYGANDAQIQEHLKVLLSRIQKEGIQTLTLSELQFIRYHTTPKPTARNIDIEALRTAWEKERQTLLSAIQALKELLAQEQQLATPDWELSSTNVDWRRELLHTLSHVFMRERDVLLSELRSYVLINSDGTDLSAVQRLEQKIIEQECQQKASLEQVICADRQSLVSEVRDMKAKLAIMQLQHHDDKEQLTDKLQELERQRCKREDQLQRHIKLLEYRLEQSRVIQDDLHSSIEMERKRTSELASELTKSKAHAMDLNGEVTNLQVNIAKVKDAFEQEHSRYLSLIVALEEEKVRTTELTEWLESEKQNVHHLQDDLENITGQLGKERDLEYQHLYLALENEKEKLKESSAITQEKQAENLSLQQELEAEKLRCQSITAKYDVTVAQLNSRLADEQSLNEQITSNLTKEKNLNIQLKQSLDKVCSIRQDTCERDRATITDLQRMLETERSSVSDLQHQLDSVREEHQTRISSLTAQHQSVKESLEKETAKFHKLKVKSDIFENQQSDLQRQLDYEKERTIRLQAEKHSLTLELQTLRQREKERYITAENEKLANNRKVKEMSRQLENQKVVMHQNELEVERLQEKVQGLEADLQNSRLRERQLVHEIEYTKLRSPQNLESFTARIRSDVMTTTSTSAMKPDTKEKEKLLSAFKSQLENIRQCLESAGMTFQDCLNKITSYLKANQTMAPASQDSFGILCSMTASVDDMLSDLRELQMSLTLEAQEGPGYPHLAAIINQRTLQHNRDLLSSIFKLSEEKLALRAQLLECEECIQNYKTRDYIQLTQNSDGDGDSLLETSFTMERIRWDQERATYELALQNCEKRIEQLQRNLRIERTQGFALSNNNTTSTTSPNINNTSTNNNNNNPLLMESDLIQTLFRKYFRAESFRKALIYQKNYLLVLLGGFQDSEQTVLALLSRMNARGNDNRLLGDSYNQGQHNRCPPLARFRSAARVIVAISRMKYLVRKLQQACALSLSGVLNLSPQHRGKFKPSGHTVPCSSSASTMTSSTFSAPLEGATAATSPHSNPFVSAPYCSLKLRSSISSVRPRPGVGHSPPGYASSVRHMVNTSSNNVQGFSPSSLATPPIKTNLTSSQSRFTTPPTKEANHLRGALEKVPSLYQLTEDHSDHIVQQNLGLPNHQPMLGLPSSTNNGDIPQSSNCDRQSPDHSTVQHCDDLSQRFEQVQSNVDQVRHSPQIERQRHRRKYDGFHKNIDL
uniref:Pericentrin/AKAP-450 centrosomal targeting domain-containing protein n=1 Tax=Octopus bimaculoides TaxID=37653 RepID=A0A0L8HVS7_OCTBM